MPGLDGNDFDERISAALSETAREPAGNGVLRNVQRKRRARQQRRTGAVALGVALVLGVGGVTTALVRSSDDDGGGRDVEIATPRSTESNGPPATLPPTTERPFEPTVEVHDGEVSFPSGSPFEGNTPAVPVAVENDPYVRGPIVPVGEARWVTTYEHDGTGGYALPGSRLTDLTSGRTIDFEGRIESFAVDDEIVWSVTHEERIDEDGVEFRVKRTAGDEAPTSHATPARTKVVGPIVVGAGYAWVPTTDGVLRFDLVTGDFVDQPLTLSHQDERSVAVVGEQVFATSGQDVVRVNGSDPGARILVAPSPILDLLGVGTDLWAVSGSDLHRLDSAVNPIQPPRPLGVPLAHAALRPLGSSVLVTGTVSINPDPKSTVTMVVSPDMSVVSTVVMVHHPDTYVAATNDSLLFASDGVLYEVPLG